MAQIEMTRLHMDPTGLTTFDFNNIRFMLKDIKNRAHRKNNKKHLYENTKNILKAKLKEISCKGQSSIFTKTGKAHKALRMVLLKL